MENTTDISREAVEIAKNVLTGIDLEESSYPECEKKIETELRRRHVQYDLLCDIAYAAIDALKAEYLAAIEKPLRRVLDSALDTVCSTRLDRALCNYKGLERDLIAFHAIKSQLMEHTRGKIIRHFILDVLPESVDWMRDDEEEIDLRWEREQLMKRLSEVDKKLERYNK